MARYRTVIRNSGTIPSCVPFGKLPKHSEFGKSLAQCCLAPQWACMQGVVVVGRCRSALLSLRCLWIQNSKLSSKRIELEYCPGNNLQQDLRSKMKKWNYYTSGHVLQGRAIEHSLNRDGPQYPTGRRRPARGTGTAQLHHYLTPSPLIDEAPLNEVKKMHKCTLQHQ